MRWVVEMVSDQAETLTRLRERLAAELTIDEAFALGFAARQLESDARKAARTLDRQAREQEAAAG